MALGLYALFMEQNGTAIFRIAKYKTLMVTFNGDKLLQLMGLIHMFRDELELITLNWRVAQAKEKFLLKLLVNFVVCFIIYIYSPLPVCQLKLWPVTIPE